VVGIPRAFAVAGTSALPNGQAMDNRYDIQGQLLDDISNAIGRYGRGSAIANDLPLDHHFSRTC
jgi:hypothetical protein